MILRAPRPSDMRDRLASGRDPEIVRMYGGGEQDLTPMTQTAAEAWYAAIAGDALGWVIEAEGRCIGGARLHHLDERNRSARFAIGIFDPSALGRGLGTEATRLLLRHAFDTLALHRIDLRVLDYNHRAIACYEKCGFVREGVQRDAALVDGEWHSDVVMGILEDEYRRASGAW